MHAVDILDSGQRMDGSLTFGGYGHAGKSDERSGANSMLCGALSGFLVLVRGNRLQNCRFYMACKSCTFEIRSY